MATIAFLFARAFRWKIIVAQLKHVTVMSSLANVSIGIMANNLLPARTGELARVASFAETENLRASSVLSALIVERLLDGYILLFIFMLSSYKVNLASSFHAIGSLRRAAFIALFGYSIVLLGLFIFRTYGTSNRFESILPLKFKFFFEKMKEFNMGLDILKDLKILTLLICLSIAVWSLSSIIILATLNMFVPIEPNICVKIGFMECLFLTGAISLALILPSAPGYFGSFHWICALVLLGFGVTNSLANSFSVFIHGSQYVLNTVLGLAFFMNRHLHFGAVLRVKGRQEI
jgi:uncharacterized protein (TIRG00374 family)